MTTERHALDRALKALHDPALTRHGRLAAALAIITIYARERVAK